jgi:predicted SAM-dependent methyltransferase
LGKRIIKKVDNEMKLHLGCGERYLEGYINIDFPPTKHTVQTNTRVDKYADILALRYPTLSVDEIRLHHVFEHFSRPVACALVVSWWSWLKPGGLLHIEVPDFDRTAWAVLNPLSSDHSRHVALRHIFGSQEADWAFHREGWSAGRLRHLLESFGYRIEQTKQNAWQGTYNVEIIANKTARNMLRDDFENAARVWLSSFMVDESPTEQRMIAVWMGQYSEQVSRTWAKA